MKLATWNINSIRVRETLLVNWLKKERPDVLCLQETKVTDDLFPRAPFEALGYHIATYGQSSYNGVCLLSKTELKDVVLGFEAPTKDDQARLITATTAGVRVSSAYIPNGNTMGCDKQGYKSAWLRQLRHFVERQGRAHGHYAIAGDFNVAPRASDVCDPEKWAKTVIFHPEMRAELAHVMAYGLTDIFAEMHPEGGLYSWWDYRTDGYSRGNGLRIDLILATPELARLATTSEIDHLERKRERPSDHVPVWASFQSVV